MRILRLPSPFSFPSDSLGTDTMWHCLFLTSFQVAMRTRKAWTVKVASPIGHLFTWRREALPCFHVTLTCLWPGLRPRPGCHNSPNYVVNSIVPTLLTVKTPVEQILRGSILTFSSRCLRFLPPSQVTRQDSLPMGG